MKTEEGQQYFSCEELLIIYNYWNFAYNDVKNLILFYQSYQDFNL